MRTVNESIRKAAKEYSCIYCGNPIHRGEKYHMSTHGCENNKKLCVWRCHQKCHDLAMAIWDFVNPCDDMSPDEFHNGLRKVANMFICSDCPNRDVDGDDCKHRLDMDCINLIHEFFEHHSWEERTPGVWSVVKIDSTENGGDGVEK